MKAGSKSSLDPPSCNAVLNAGQHGPVAAGKRGNGSLQALGVRGMLLRVELLLGPLDLGIWQFFVASSLTNRPNAMIQEENK